MKLNERRLLKLAGLLSEAEEKQKASEKIVSTDVKRSALKNPDKKYAKVVKYNAAPIWRFWNKEPDVVVEEYYGDSVTTTVPLKIAKKMIDKGIVTDQSAEELKVEIEKMVSGVSPHLTPEVQARGVFKIEGDNKYQYYIMDDLLHAVAIYDKAGELKATKKFKIPAGSSLDKKVADGLRDGKKQGLGSATVIRGMSKIFKVDAPKDVLNSKGKYLMNQMKSIYNLDDQQALKLARMVALYNQVDADNPFEDEKTTSLKLPAINGVAPGTLSENLYFNNLSIFDRPLLSESQLRFLEKHTGVRQITEETVEPDSLAGALDVSKVKLIMSGGIEDTNGSQTKFNKEKMKTAIANLIPGQMENFHQVGYVPSNNSLAHDVYMTQDGSNVFINTIDGSKLSKVVTGGPDLPSPMALMTSYNEDDPTASASDLADAFGTGPISPPTAIEYDRYDLSGGESLWVQSDKEFYYYITSKKGDHVVASVENFYSGSVDSSNKELNPFANAALHGAGSDTYSVLVVISNDDAEQLELDISNPDSFPLEDLKAFANQSQETKDAYSVSDAQLEKFFKDVNDAIETETNGVKTVLTLDEDSDGVPFFVDLDDTDSEVGASDASSLKVDGSATFDEFVSAFEQGVSLQESRNRAKKIDQSSINELRKAARRSLLNLMK